MISRGKRKKNDYGVLVKLWNSVGQSLTYLPVRESAYGKDINECG